MSLASSLIIPANHPVPMSSAAEHSANLMRYPTICMNDGCGPMKRTERQHDADGINMILLVFSAGICLRVYYNTECGG